MKIHAEEALMSTERKQNVQYLIFDIEAIADGDLVSKIRYPKESMQGPEAIARYRAELLATTGKDVLPVTFMLPISVAVAKVDADYRLLDLAVLDAPQFRPHVIAKHFWQGWNGYGRPTLVSFNGRGYDLPVLELAAYRYGYSVPAWFNVEARAYDQSRNRYNLEMHLDLFDLLSNYGAARLSGGLNLLANLIGKPGKAGVDGSQVQDMYDRGESVESCWARSHSKPSMNWWPRRRPGWKSKGRLSRSTSTTCLTGVTGSHQSTKPHCSMRSWDEVADTTIIP
jgi:predicted PolB exonuclease-like 3'-5' exonuclease